MPHGNTLCQQFGQTLHDLQEHTLHDGTTEVRVVVGHVLGETAQRERLLHVHLGVVLAVGGRVLVVLVLSEINPQCNLFCCHSSCVYLNSFCVGATIFIGPPLPAFLRA